MLDFLCILFRTVWVVSDDQRSKVSVIDRVVDGDRDLVLGIVVDDSTPDRTPHGLRIKRKKTDI